MPQDADPLTIVVATGPLLEEWRSIHNAVIPTAPLSRAEVDERSGRNRLTLGYVGGDRTAVYALGCIGHGVSMSYRNGQVLAELLLRDSEEAVGECPFVNRRTIPWPSEPLASVAKHALRDYLRAEDAVHEKILARVARGVGQ